MATPQKGDRRQRFREEVADRENREARRAARTEAPAKKAASRTPAKKP